MELTQVDQKQRTSNDVKSDLTFASPTGDISTLHSPVYGQVLPKKIALPYILLAMPIVLIGVLVWNYLHAARLEDNNKPVTITECNDNLEPGYGGISSRSVNIATKVKDSKLTYATIARTHFHLRVNTQFHLGMNIAATWTLSTHRLQPRCT